MRKTDCPTRPAPACAIDHRRERVRRSGELAGIDYVEVYPDRVTLCVHFFGSVPDTLRAEHVIIEGGDRIRDIRVLHADFERHADEHDTCLRVVVDRTGDFSPYCLCLVEPQRHTSRCSDDALRPAPLLPRVPDGIDPRYACATFGFRIDCPSDLDCSPPPCADTSMPPLSAMPSIDYLARDFTGLRRLMLDRLAVTMPGWHERHIPDIGVTLVELFAYVADQLSYMLDAVATEAWLGTARRRISVRRHARLLDYRMHEGCNARAWVAISADTDLRLPFSDIVFAAAPQESEGASPGLVSWQDLRSMKGAALFEPMAWNGAESIDIIAAHSLIHFHTWGDSVCCLPQGATHATLRDEVDATNHQRILRLGKGSMLIFEQIRGAASGDSADADPAKRCVVQLTQVMPHIDPLDGTALLEIEWERKDALPFDLCLSARSRPPECKLVEVAVARGNVVLVDHGLTMDEANKGWVVGVESTQACCACNGSVADVTEVPAPLSMTLSQTDVTHATPMDVGSVNDVLLQDPRLAMPQIWLDAAPPDGKAWPGRYDWLAVPDLLSSAPDDSHFVAEFDDDGHTQLRFGDGEGGRQPKAGLRFRARYRVGNGTAGNVGQDAIVWMARRAGPLSGVDLRVRNPIAARGGMDREPVSDVRVYAPKAYGRVLARAVTAEDYAELAAQDPRVDGAFAELAWTGSWYEASVAIDRLEAAQDDARLESDILQRLQAARRIGHDLRCVPVHRLPLVIVLDVCVMNGYRGADVKRAVLDALSTRRLPNGVLGFFHPDLLDFGQPIAASALIRVVQCIEGVVRVNLLHFARANADAAEAARSLFDNMVSVAPDEIVQLDNDPDHPENGTLTVILREER